MMTKYINWALIAIIAVCGYLVYAEHGKVVKLEKELALYESSMKYQDRFGEMLASVISGQIISGKVDMYLVKWIQKKFAYAWLEYLEIEDISGNKWAIKGNEMPGASVVDIMINNKKMGRVKIKVREAPDGNTTH